MALARPLTQANANIYASWTHQLVLNPRLTSAAACAAAVRAPSPCKSRKETVKNSLAERKRQESENGTCASYNSKWQLQNLRTPQQFLSLAPCMHLHDLTRMWIKIPSTHLILSSGSWGGPAAKGFVQVALSQHSPPAIPVIGTEELVKIFWVFVGRIHFHDATLSLGCPLAALRLLSNCCFERHPQVIPILEHKLNYGAYREASEPVHGPLCIIFIHL